MLLAIELIQIPFMEGIAESIEIILHDQFAKFGSLIVFFYAMLPTIFKVIGTGGIFIRLLDNGISPLFMFIMSLIGKMIGFYLLYLAGRFFWQLLNKNKKKKQELLPENHWIHKYRHVLYLAVPWFGSVGEVFIIISGHQRIGFLRILPFLAVSEGVRYGINLMLLLGQLELPNLL
jgi:membrane protein YqaA with SNARE-associated domain